MLSVNSLVLYKNNGAVVAADDGNGKWTVKFRSVPATATKPAQYSTQSVRTKDFVFLAEKVSGIEKVLEIADKCSGNPDNIFASGVQEAWELLVSDDSTAHEAMNFDELKDLVKGDANPDETLGIFVALKESPRFVFDQKEYALGNLKFTPRSQEEIDAIALKAQEKDREAAERLEFIKRLKQKKLDLPGDAKFMSDVEALALGKTDKSRSMKEAGFRETAEKAHRLLLDTGIWTPYRNPYPLRWGLTMQSANVGLDHPPVEERTEISGISYAIDNAYSADPDDAVAFDGKYLWVHIADPASSVEFDSPIEKTAMDRGTTLYMPEGTSRMLSEDCLEDYALGLKEKSNALSFRLELDENAQVLDCQVMKTIVYVKRYTYQQAEELKESPELKPLFEIARRNIEKRNRAGAVQISLPEVHIVADVQQKKVTIETEEHPESSIMVREMMLLAGEGAAKFAFKNSIPFVYVSQDSPDMPAEIPEGLAGEYRKRKCMKRRSVGVTPSFHSGLGIGMYSQVTSPLRRYGDLISHIQLRKFLDGGELLDKDTMLMKISAGDAAGGAAVKAERKSNLHWTLVYLLEHPDWSGKAVCVDNSGKVPYFMVPELAMESYIAGTGDVDLNGEITVKVQNIDLSELTFEFVKV